MAERKKRRKRQDAGGTPDWMVTYGDMTTLLLTFFILMFTTATIDGHELRLILASFQGLGPLGGGKTLEEGKLVELGHTVEALPSREHGRALSQARRTAIAQFQPELKTKKVRLKEDERGLVISLAGDAFFDPASAELNMEESRNVLQKLTLLLGAPELAGRKFRIEGHTDAAPTDPAGEWPSNWELSTARATNVLHYLVDFGAADGQPTRLFFLVCSRSHVLHLRALSELSILTRGESYLLRLEQVREPAGLESLIAAFVQERKAA